MVPLSYNLRSLAARKTTTLATVLGIGLVVFVLASALMLAHSVRATIGQAGRRDTAIVFRKGSDAEMASSFEVARIPLVFAAPGVRAGPDGAPLGVAEFVFGISLEKLGTDGGVSNVQIRGVSGRVQDFRPGVRFVAGRAPRPGSNEGAVGAKIRGRFRGLELGQTLELRRNRPVTIVGVFDDGGSAYESEVWADVDTVRAATGSEGMVSSIRVRLTSPEAFDAFEAVVEQDRRLGLEAMRETDFYEKQSEGTSAFVTALGATVAAFLAVGAMLGAMITMYSSVASRQREVGTLRALGFARRSVLVSFVFEALVVALVGGALGTLASLGMVFVKFSIMNFQSFSEVVFGFTPTPGILATALAFAAAMGLLGGLLPAVRAARLSPVEAMR